MKPITTKRNAMRRPRAHGEDPSGAVVRAIVVRKGKCEKVVEEAIKHLENNGLIDVEILGVKTLSMWKMGERRYVACNYVRRTIKIESDWFNPKKELLDELEGLIDVFPSKPAKITLTNIAGMAGRSLVNPLGLMNENAY